MASPTLPFREPAIAGDRIPHPAHLLILLMLSLGALTWGSILITGHQGTSFQAYVLLLGLFGAASAAFILFRVRRDRLNLFSIPVFVTILVLARFGLFPLYAFANPEALDRNFLGRYDLLVKALLLVAPGMLAFWLGNACFSRRKRENSDLANRLVHPRTSGLHGSILPMTAGLYGVAFAAKAYLLHASLLN